MVQECPQGPPKQVSHSYRTDWVCTWAPRAKAKLSKAWPWVRRPFSALQHLKRGLSKDRETAAGLTQCIGERLRRPVTQAFRVLGRSQAQPRQGGAGTTSKSRARASPGRAVHRAVPCRCKTRPGPKLEPTQTDGWSSLRGVLRALCAKLGGLPGGWVESRTPRTPANSTQRAHSTDSSELPPELHTPVSLGSLCVGLNERQH